MNRADFQALSRLRRSEAGQLLRAELYAGAYHLSGLAVECALKACVAKLTKRHDFPDRDLATASYTHDLERLLQIAALTSLLRTEARTNRQLQINWEFVKDWNIDSRYSLSISPARALDMYRACAGRQGILGWLRRRW